MLLIRILIILTLLQSCQHLRKEDLSTDQLTSAKLVTQLKIYSPEQNKSLSAKANWYIQRPFLLRLDILGPFDLLLAQAYRDDKKLVVLDHRKKTVTQFNAQKPILVDQIELPLAELQSLLLERQPKSWNCPVEAKDQLCQKGELTSSWPETDQLKLQHPKFEFTLTIKEKIDNPTFDSKIFKLSIPNSYQVK